MSECNQHLGGSAGRQILLLKMNHPEGLCLAKVRLVPETTGSRGMARYRGILLTPPAGSGVCPYGVTLGSTTPVGFWNKVKDRVSSLNLNSLVMADERVKRHLSTSQTREAGDFCMETFYLRDTSRNQRMLLSPR